MGKDSSGAESVLLGAYDLRCERDERVLFEGLTLELLAGEVLQVEGPNGSGKTTLLRYLAGLSSRCEGVLQWKGVDTLSSRYEFSSDSLYVGHESAVKLSLTPVENLRWHAALWQRPMKRDIDSALQQVGLSGYEDTPAQNLSAGQRRRIGLARLYLSPAQLWILDEPFTAIDKDGVAQLESLIADHAEQGGCAVLTTHHALAMRGRLRRLVLGLGAGEQQ